MKVDEIIEELYALIKRELSPDLSYHSLRHTQDVHETCQFYIQHYQLPQHSAALLEIAAAGHDVGFTRVYANHEIVSAEITGKIMRKYGHIEEDIAIVEELILATKIPQSPTNFLAQILCDADLDYLGRDDFPEIGQLLKKEWQTYNIIPNLDENFDNIQISFLNGHTYHTAYAMNHRGPVKRKNLEVLKERLAEA